MSRLTPVLTPIFAFALILLAAMPVRAQSMIRDAEIETGLRIISRPILSAAGLNPSQVRIILINDDAINAFVAGGQNLFLYTGLILEAKTVGQLAGVMAHEAGHMAGGHLVRMRDIAENASIESLVSSVLGVMVGVGAGDAGAGVAASLGGTEFARRSMLSHSRVLESSADQAGMMALERAGYSSRDMADFLEILSSEEVLPEMQRSSYVLTHPLSRDRLQTVQAFVAKSRNKDKAWPAAWQEYFKRMQAKLMAFTVPDQALREYAADESIAGRYARSIAQYRKGHIAEALELLGGLEKEEPDNPYFAELHGQILFEQSRISDAIVSYRRAVTLAPKQALIRFALAQALLQNEKQDPAEAIQHLQAAISNGERATPMIYRWLAVAYGRQGRDGMAKLSLAEESLLKGDYGFAIDQAKRAEKQLAKDATARQRARDIIAAAQRGIEKRKEKN